MENKLVEMLDQLFTLNEILIESLKVEHEHLITNNIEGLKGINVTQLELSDQIKKIELARIELVKAIAKKHQLKKEDIKLDDLFEMMDEEMVGRLNEKREQLKVVLAKIMRLRELNNRLIKKILDFNDQNIRLLIDLGNRSLTYNDQGDINESRKRLLDSVV